MGVKEMGSALVSGEKDVSLKATLNFKWGEILFALVPFLKQRAIFTGVLRLDVTGSDHVIYFILPNKP